MTNDTNTLIDDYEAYSSIATVTISLKDFSALLAINERMYQALINSTGVISAFEAERKITLAAAKSMPKIQALN
jgi:hypothetical protein